MLCSDVFSHPPLHLVRVFLGVGRQQLRGVVHIGLIEAFTASAGASGVP